MSEPARIVCGPGRVPAPVGRWRNTKTIRLRIGSGRRDVHLRLDRLTDSLAASAAAVCVDLLELASYVYAADQALARGGTRQFDYGDRWRRTLRFEVPVRRLEVWNRPDVTATLSECLRELTDDLAVEFHFRSGGSLPSLRQYLFDGVPAAAHHDFEEVIPFSGGVDSLGGAVQEVLLGQRKVLLVGHRSVSKVATRQADLASAVVDAADRGKRPLYVPFDVNKGKALGREFTQRSRSFLFASVSAVVARQFGLNRVRFFENGVTSLNLPISPQMIGGRAGRRTRASCAVLRSSSA